MPIIREFVTLSNPTSFNTLLTPGTYAYGSNLTDANSPGLPAAISAKAGRCTVETLVSGYTGQTFVGMNTRRMFYRVYNSSTSTWSGPTEINTTNP